MNSENKNLKGHLQPLGQQCEPGNEILVLKEIPDCEVFFHNHVNPNQPVIFRRGASHWIAIKQWNDKYLASKAGKALLDIELGKKELRTRPRSQMNMADFLNCYGQQDIYAVTDLPEELIEDLELPACIDQGNIAHFLETDSVFWMNSGGAKSLLHLDDYENLLCVIDGTKQVTLAPPKHHQTARILSHSGYSSMDVDHVDLNEFSGVSEIPFQFAELGPGDILFIPQYWLHQLTSVNRSIAINFWWRQWVAPHGLGLKSTIDLHQRNIVNGSAENSKSTDRDISPLQNFLTKRKNKTKITASTNSKQIAPRNHFEIRPLFSTPIYLSHLPDHERININISKFVQSLKQEDKANRDHSGKGYNPHGVGYTSYFEDRTDQILGHSDLQELVSFLVKCSIEYMRQLRFKLENHRIGIDRVWVNINSQGSYHLAHRHPGSVVSGVYYISIPEPNEGGELVFQDPLDAHRMAEPSLPSEIGRKIYPSSGLLVLFPSWLEHEVRLQKSSGNRISLAFNSYATAGGVKSR